MESDYGGKLNNTKFMAFCCFVKLSTSLFWQKRPPQGADGPFYLFNWKAVNITI